MSDIEGLLDRIHPGSLVHDILATGYQDIYLELWEPTNPETEKMLGRAIAGWAARHPRPNHYPWNQPNFDRFWAKP